MKMMFRLFLLLFILGACNNENDQDTNAPGYEQTDTMQRNLQDTLNRDTMNRDTMNRR